MGCNCKNKAKEVKKIDVVAEDLNEKKVIAIELIKEMNDLIPVINTDKTAKERLHNFFRDTQGIVLTEYCDTICMKRLRKVLGKMEQDISNEPKSPS